MSVRRLSFFLLVLTLAPCSISPAFSQDGRWAVGIRLQGVVDFAPGNDYLYGLEVGYSNAHVLDNKLDVQFAYLTSRPEAAFRNVLKQDWFLLSPAWHFRPQRFFDPVVQLDFGYQRYDLENKAFEGYLKNDTWVYGGKTGFNLNFGDEKRYSVNYRLGYQQSSSASSVVYPLPFSLAFTTAFQ